MKATYSVFFIVGIAVGGVLGYTTASISSKDLQSNLSILQAELKSFSSQYATSRQIFNKGLYTDHPGRSLLHGTWDEQRWLSEIKSIVDQAVSSYLQDALIYEDPCRLAYIQSSSGQQSSVTNKEAGPTVDESFLQESVAITEEVLAAAIDRGVWTQDDASAYRNAILKLPGENIHEANRRLSVAINNGDIEFMMESIQ